MTQSYIIGVIAVIITIAGLLWYFRKRNQKEIISIVILLREPKNLSVKKISSVIKKNYNMLLSTEESDDGYIATMSPNKSTTSFFIDIKRLNRRYLINSSQLPYIENHKKVAKKIKDLRFRKAFEKHNSWLSIDWAGQVSEEKVDDIYKGIGRLLVEFIDEKSLALYFPEFNKGYVVNEETKNTLLSEDPLFFIDKDEEAPVLEISSDNPKMKKAVKEANERWPEFVEAFNSGNENLTNFLIKAPITDGKNTEYIWIDVKKINKDTIKGELENKPINVKNAKLGDPVTVSLEDLNDWMYIKNGEDMVGGFTMKVIIDAQK